MLLSVCIYSNSKSIATARQITIQMLQRKEKKKKREEEKSMKGAALNRKRWDLMLLVLLLYRPDATPRYTCNFQPLSEDLIAATENSSSIMEHEIFPNYKTRNSDLWLIMKN